MLMKITNLLIALLFCVCTGNAQSPIGGWQAKTTDANGNELNVSAIVTETHQVITWYDTSGDFIKTMGGSWILYGDRWQLNV